MADLSQMSDDELMAAAVLPSLINQESGGRAGVLGPQTRWGRAEGQTQMLPKTAEATAKRIGVAWRPELMRGTSSEAADYQAGLGQAYLEEGLAQTGNLPDALRYYHGGPDRKQWGPKTEAYQASIMAKSGLGSPQPQSSASGLSDAELMAIAGVGPSKTSPPRKTAPAPQVSLDAMKKFAGPPPSVKQDVIKAVPSGLMGTLASMNPMNAFGGGAVLDVLDQAANKASMIQNLLSGKPVTVKDLVKLPALPGARSADLTVKATGQDYTPKTRQGQIAKTTGAMLPNIIAPGTIPQRLAAVALPTLGTEGAGSLAEMMGAGPKTEAAARLAGGLAGSLASSIRIAPGVKPTKPLDLEGLRKSKQDAYKAVDAVGAVYKPAAVKGLKKTILDDMATNELDADLHPKVAATVKVLGRRLSSGPVSLSKLDDTRQVVRRNIFEGNATPEEKRLGGMILDKIDEFVDGADARQMDAGDAKGAAAAISKARDMNTRFKKVEGVTDALYTAENRTATAGSGGNIDNASRQNLRRILEKSKNLTPAEKAAMLKVVRGGKGQNLLRTVGRLSPTNGMMASGFGIAATAGSGGAGAVIPITGMIAKLTADGMTKKNIAKLLDLMAEGGGKVPKAQGMPPKVSIDPALAAARGVTMTPGLFGSAYANQGTSR